MPTLIEVLLLTQVGATLVMVSVISFAQIVHYLLMARVSTSDFAAYEHEHQNRTTFVVAPTMLVKGVTAIALFALWPPDTGRILPVLGIGLLAVIRLSTFLVRVPLHTLLDGGFDAGVHRKQVWSNWLLTLAWTGRGGLVLVVLRAM